MSYFTILREGTPYYLTITGDDIAPVIISSSLTQFSRVNIVNNFFSERIKKCMESILLDNCNEILPLHSTEFTYYQIYAESFLNEDNQNNSEGKDIRKILQMIVNLQNIVEKKYVTQHVKKYISVF